MATIEKEIVAYELMRDELEEDHKGKWVLVHDEELIGAYTSFQVAANEAAKRFGRGPYLIRQIGARPPRLSSTVLYGIR